MKKYTLIVPIALAAALAVLCAGCTADVKKTTVKSYTLDTCVVCDMKLDHMGKPYTFV